MESKEERELRYKLANEEIARALKSMKSYNFTVEARTIPAKEVKHLCPVCGKRCARMPKEEREKPSDV